MASSLASTSLSNILNNKSSSVDVIDILFFGLLLGAFWEDTYDLFSWQTIDLIHSRFEQSRVVDELLCVKLW